MKKFLLICLLFSLNVGASPFTDGTVLTAAALNSAFGNAVITSGTIVGATIDNSPIGGVTPAAISATTISATGQLTSTVATGTAPLVVSSTTPVANLAIGGNAATATTATNLSGGTVNATSGVFSGGATISGGVLSPPARAFSLAQPLAGRLQTNIALGTSPGISSYLDLSSFEISAGSTNKNGIYIGAMSATDPNVVRVYSGNINTLTSSPTGIEIVGTITATGAITTNGKTVLSTTDTTAGQAPVAITVGASPFTYTATYGGSVAVSGGTVSNLALTRAGVTIWNTTLSSDVIPVRAGDTVIVTWTVAPIMYQVSN